MANLQLFLDSLAKSAQAAKDWFWAETSPKSRDDFFARGKLGDNGTGAVYAYLDEDDYPLYVGEASRPIKRRMHDQTSPHKQTEWWSQWHTVRLLSVRDRTDRLTLELMLVLALNPPYNVKPGRRRLDQMYGSSPNNSSKPKSEAAWLNSGVSARD